MDQYPPADAGGPPSGSGRVNLTAFQKELHAMSTKQSARPKAKGAFGGCTRDERALRSIKRRLAQ